MKGIVPFLIFAVVIILRVIAAAASQEQQKKRAGDKTEDGWEPFSGGRRGGPDRNGSNQDQPRGMPTPSDRVSTILQQLREQAERERGSGMEPTGPPPPPTSPPPSPPRVKPVSATSGSRPVSVERAEVVVPPQRRARARLMKRERPPPVSKRPRIRRTEIGSEVGQGVGETRDVAREALGGAFPSYAAMPAVLGTGGPKRRVVIRIRGRKDLRMGVVLSEVLGQPRAFDL